MCSPLRRGRGCASGCRLRNRRHRPRYGGRAVVGYGQLGLGGRGEDTYGRSDGEVTAETHARRADEAGAGGKAQEVVDGFVGVGVVRLKGLGQA